MKPNASFVPVLDKTIRSVVRDALRVSWTSPSLALFMLRTLWNQRSAGKRRRLNARKGVHIPPFMIVSVTHKCNLRCKGCYAQMHHQSEKKEMSKEQLEQLFSEAEDLGINIALIAGGEPFTRPDLMEVMANHQRIVFPVFTNGLFINSQAVNQFRRSKNIVPVLSIEGHEEDTDLRRGQGMHEKLQSAIRTLQMGRVFFGVSITVTKTNIATVTSAEFVRDLVRQGCKLFIYVDYIPVQQGTDHLVPDKKDVQNIVARMDELRSEFPALFISFPGDEDKFGGCLAAGRGFVHISPEGDVEPCPFSPYSDQSLQDVPLKVALQSDLLRIIRENEGRLTETKGGCALWENRGWVQSLLNK